MNKFLLSILQKLSKSQREQKIRLFSDAIQNHALILDIGVWCTMPEPNPSENWLEKQYGQQARIIAVGLEDMAGFQQKYPAVMCVRADGRALPFRSECVDTAFSNAVLEHVPQDDQKDFVEEIARVSRRRAIFTVPDRLSPIEIHSKIFFLHWLPNWRGIFARLGEKFWSNPRNLSTLFTRASLSRLLKQSSARGAWTVKRQTLLGLPVSLIATYRRDED